MARSDSWTECSSPSTSWKAPWTCSTSSVCFVESSGTAGRTRPRSGRGAGLTPRTQRTRPGSRPTTSNRRGRSDRRNKNGVAGMLPVDATGQIHGRLLLLARRRVDDTTLYWCRCSCGREIWVSWSNLQTGNTKSCGCLRQETTGKRARKPITHVILTQVFGYYKRNAKMRNIPWKLEKHTFKELIFGPCAYCGTAAGTVTHTSWSTSKDNNKMTPNRSLPNNGVDRVDSTLGYTKANTVSCCKQCNFAKRSQ